MSDRPEIDKSRTIPLYIADQAIAAADAEIQKLRADNARLKAQIEQLTKQVERLIVSLHKSHDEHAEALYKLKYKNERQTPRKKRSS